MGGITISKFQQNNMVPGRDDIAVSVFREIGLTQDDINKFWHEFSKMDTKKCGAITKIELFHYFKVEENDLTTKLFRTFDIDDSGKLDFCEFTLNFWNYLTIELYYLPTFLFYTFDDDQSGTLDFFEVQSLVDTLHGEKNVHIHEIVSELQDKTPIDQAQFRRFCADNKSLYSPIEALQCTMRDKLLGNSFWMHMMEKRQNRVKQLHPDFAPRLARTMKERIDNKKLIQAQNLEAVKRDQAIAELSSRREGMGLGRRTAPETTRLPNEGISSRRLRSSFREGSVRSRPDSREKSVRFALDDAEPLSSSVEGEDHPSRKLTRPDSRELGMEPSSHRPRSRERSAGKSPEGERTSSRESARTERSVLSNSFEGRPASRDSDSDKGTDIVRQHGTLSKGKSDRRSVGTSDGGRCKPPRPTIQRANTLGAVDMESRYSSLKSRVAAAVDNELKVPPRGQGGEQGEDTEKIFDKKNNKKNLGPVRTKGLTAAMRYGTTNE